MSVWSKIVTAMRGGATEVGEAIVDNQALRILDQEIRDAGEELKKAEQSLTSVMAKRKMSASKVAELEKSATEYENHARSSAEKGDSDLALECATKVGQLRADLDAEQQYLATFKQSESTLKANIDKAKKSLKQMKQKVDHIKATEAVNKAQAACSSRHTGANSKMKTALESMERIEKRQVEQQATFEAAEELANAESGSDLDEKLKSAGIVSGGTSSAEDELARILGKK
ncbi:MAG: PspA/IM30 family protein [Pseudomonadales bacterium]|nr:PspA/IM30 family protein [Pseudomonadales bacterium]